MILFHKNVFLPLYDVLVFSQLLSEIQKVNFTENNTQIYFNSDGDPSLGYDIVYWNRSDCKKGMIIQTIGEYSPDGKITVPTDLFRHLINDMVR